MADHYVWSGATGSATGADWTNAYTDLPSSLVRGDTYHIAGGAYGVWDLKDAESGSSIITIQKAQASTDSGVSGWSASYASSVAHIQNIIFETGYYTIDGKTGGGPGSWESGFGFLTYPDLSWTFPISIAGAGQNHYPPMPTNITLLHIDVQGAGFHHSGVPDGLNSATINPTGPGCGPSNLTIEYCYIHDTALGQASVRFQWVNYFTFKYNEVARNYCTSTGHSEAMIIDASNYVTIAYNKFIDVEGSALLAVGEQIAGTTINNDIHVFGNVFYWTSGYEAETGCGVGVGFFGHNKGDGMPTYVITNAKVYNNTIVGISGANVHNSGVYIPDGTGNEVYNNLCVNCSNASIVISDAGTPSGTEDYNTQINCTSTGWAGTNDEVLASGDPFIDSAGYDFRLVAPTAAGIDASANFTVDILGHLYNTGSWDRGAFAYGSAVGAQRSFRMVM